MKVKLDRITWFEILCGGVGLVLGNHMSVYVVLIRLLPARDIVCIMVFVCDVVSCWGRDGLL